MFWYVAHVKNGFATKIVSVLNKQDNIDAFIPKKEMWFRGVNGKKYRTVELYPDYVFIRSQLNRDDFHKAFKEFFKTISGLVELLDYDSVYPLSMDEQLLFEHLLDKGNVIKRTKGLKINSCFIPTSGPLKGLEDRIIKVNRHDRYAILDMNILNNKMKLPIEELSPS
jgi:transcription antitermination factor NusG